MKKDSNPRFESPVGPADEPLPLPPIDDELLRRSQSGGAAWDDARRFPRIATSGEATLTSEGTYGPVGPPSRAQVVLIRDLSRGGVRILHPAELFPGERAVIAMPGGAKMRLEVVWCRRMATGTYLAGCRFLTIGERSASAAQSPPIG